MKVCLSAVNRIVSMINNTCIFSKRVTIKDNPDGGKFRRILGCGCESKYNQTLVFMCPSFCTIWFLTTSFIKILSQCLYIRSVFVQLKTDCAKLICLHT